MKDIYYKENPFLPELRQRVKSVVKSRRHKGPIMTYEGDFLRDDNGVITVTTSSGRYPSFEDDDQYIKFYLENIPLLRNISAPGIQVFSHILECLKPKNDVVYLNSAQIAKKLEISRTHVYTGIKSLCNVRMIARAYTGKRKSVAYWINPNVFYNGNRQHLLTTKSR